jgi:enoyl-CoA hydratase/carnithine racemase
VSGAGRTTRPHDHLEVTRDPEDGVAVLRIDREEALGALSRTLMETLRDQVELLRADEATRAVVLTGTGKGFIAGADIGEYHGVSQAAFDAYQRLGREVFSGVAALPQYTIAAVNGFALGGGFEIALCCDAIVASERARFGLPEIKLGLLPGGGGTQRLARALGTRFTKELVVTGRIVRVDELHRRGLLASVHPPDELLDAALELAREVAGQAPLCVRRAKRVIDDGIDLELDDALTLEQAALSELFATADAAEGIDAFVEKRAPRFRGA